MERKTALLRQGRPFKMHNSVVLVYSQSCSPIPTSNQFLECFHHPRRNSHSLKHHLPSPPFPQSPWQSPIHFLSFWLFCSEHFTSVGSCNTRWFVPSAFHSVYGFQGSPALWCLPGAPFFCWQRGCGLGIWNVPKLGTGTPTLTLLGQGLTESYGYYGNLSGLPR